MSAVSQPTRRTLVKGAAWSVPVVTVAGIAPASAQSPADCQVVLGYTCTPQGRQAQRIEFTIAVTGDDLPEVLTLQLTTTGSSDTIRIVDGAGTYQDGTITLSSPYATTPVVLVEALRVASNCGNAVRSFTLSLSDGASTCSSNTLAFTINGCDCP